MIGPSPCTSGDEDYVGTASVTFEDIDSLLETLEANVSGWLRPAAWLRSTKMGAPDRPYLSEVSCQRACRRTDALIAKQFAASAPWILPTTGTDLQRA